METINTTISTIPNFFANKSVFLTGATGFCGKAILEKLIRGCPEITKVYVLVRSHKDQSGNDRINEILKTTLFDRVRVECPESLEKVVPINGDVSYDELGLTTEDAAMLREDVSVVIHSAAIVHFGIGLQTVLKVNVGGTKNMLDWAKQLKHLKAFVHISTAFSNSGRLKIDEKVYPNVVSPQAALQLCSLLPADLLNSMDSQLRGDNLMNYTFSKHLAEMLVEESRFDIPVCIVRPSVVTPAFKEPIPGWIDNLTGFNGVIAAVSRGLIHTSRLNSRSVVDIIPVDHVVNLTLAAAMSTAVVVKTSEDIMVYNCSSSEHPFKFQDLFQILVKANAQNPYKRMYWYPFMIFTWNEQIKEVLDFILHYMPCVLVDGAFMVVGSKPKIGMVATYNKLKKLFKVVEDLVAKDYELSTTNTKALFKQLTPLDQECFDFDISTLHHETYSLVGINGVRRYGALEDDRNLPTARRNFKRFERLHHGLLAFLILLAGFVVKMFLF